jgi:N-acetylneuraminic acid mutarotase
VAYDPETDGWRQLPDPPGYSVEQFNGPPGPGVWTGSELLVPSADLAFDPGTERWRSTAPSPLAERSWATTVWTGDRLFVWGGCFEAEKQCDESNSGLFGDGALYDPATDTWEPVAPSPLDPAVHVEAGWTGSEVVLAVTEPAPGSTGPTAAAYDPATDTWRVLPDLPLSPRRYSGATVADGRLVVWGGTANMALEARRDADGAVFDPATGTWTRFSVDVAFAREYPAMTALAGLVYVTGGRPDPRPFTFVVPDGPG